jgi:hypothetical protein
VTTTGVQLLSTVAGHAAELQCSTSFLYRHTQKAASDPIPVACWVGNRPRFKLADVEIWLQARKPTSTCDNLASGSVVVRDHYIPEFVNKRKPGTRRGYLQMSTSWSGS